MKKINSKICLSLFTIILTFVALGSTAYAWFSMNTTVSVTGLEISASLSSNLMIDNYDNGNWRVDDTTFSSGFNSNITNTVLAPVSTVNGVNFFYASPFNVELSGSVINSEYNVLDSNFANLKVDYTSNSNGYIDYHFILRAYNSGESTLNVNLTDLDMIYDGAIDNHKAFRVAVFSKEFVTANYDGTKTAPNANEVASLKSILALTDATNFTTNKAVNSTTSVDTITNYRSNTVLGTLSTQGFKYFEVIVRIYLEGEDETCRIGIYSALENGKWDLNLGIKLEEGTGSPTNHITKYCTYTIGSNKYYSDGTNVFTKDEELGYVVYNGPELSQARTAFGIE